MMKKILHIALSVFLILLPLLLTIVIFLLPPQFSATFVGELNEKHDRLSEIDKPKIVIVGGSSVAFGIDSAKLAQQTGYEVVNFGLYADLGTKIMLDLSQAHINKGDIVILAPELDEQTLSLFFNGETTLKAADDNPSMLFELDPDNYGDLWGGLWHYLSDKAGDLFDGAPVIGQDSVYRSDVFNEYGDIDSTLFPRTENIMTRGYDPNKEVFLDGSIYDSEFLDYLNDYIEKAEKRGATVYYSFCPVNSASVNTDAAEEKLGASANQEEKIAWLSASLVSFVQEKINCPVLGNPSDSIMEPLYFYDTNFHLNDYGVQLHTGKLIDLLNASETESTNAYQNAMRTPGMLYGDDQFLYRLLEDGSYSIYDVTDTMRFATSLLVPSFVTNALGTVAVTGMEKGALDKCRKIDLLLIPADSPLAELDEECFSMCSSLRDVYLFCSPIPLKQTETPLPVTYSVPVAMLSAYREKEGFSGSDVLLQKASVSESALTGVVLSGWNELFSDGAEVVVSSDLFFNYRQLTDGTFVITSLTEQGLQQKTLVIPEYFNYLETDYAVTGIDMFTFSGAMVLKNVIVPSQTNLHDIYNSAFSGSSVERLYLYPDFTQFGVPSSEMVSGTVSSFAIYIYGQKALNEYKGGYGWVIFDIAPYHLYRLNTLSEEALISSLAQSQDNTDVSAEKTLDPIWKALFWVLGGLALLAFAFFLLWYLYDRLHPVAGTETDSPEKSSKNAPDGQ